MDKKLRNLIIALLIIAIVTPIGLIAAGETFGEWGGEELVEKIGYVPQGIGSLWNAPLSDYGIPGLNAPGRLRDLGVHRDRPMRRAHLPVRDADRQARKGRGLTFMFKVHDR